MAGIINQAGLWEFCTPRSASGHRNPGVFRACFKPLGHLVMALPPAAIRLPQTINEDDLKSYALKIVKPRTRTDRRASGCAVPHAASGAPHVHMFRAAARASGTSSRQTRRARRATSGYAQAHYVAIRFNRQGRDLIRATRPSRPRVPYLIAGASAGLGRAAHGRAGDPAGRTNWEGMAGAPGRHACQPSWDQHAAALIDVTSRLATGAAAEVKRLSQNSAW